MTKYIEFSIDYNDNCECVDEFIVNGEPVEIDDCDVQPLIDELKKVKGFYTSEHRTEVRVWWNENGTMDVRFRYFNEPDWGEFDDHELLGLPPIEFEHEEV